jgi:hypothetical protein
MDLRGPLAPAAQWFVIGVFAILALAQLGIPTGVLTVLAAVAAAGVALTAALAFGLGGRELARDVSAGRYVGSAFSVGQEITDRGHRGQIVAIEGRQRCSEQSTARACGYRTASCSSPTSWSTPGAHRIRVTGSRAGRSSECGPSRFPCEGGRYANRAPTRRSTNG